MPGVTLLKGLRFVWMFNRESHKYLSEEKPDTEKNLRKLVFHSSVRVSNLHLTGTLVCRFECVLKRIKREYLM